MEQPAPFHQQLRYERELRGWSQADVASKVGVDTKTVGRWENGKTLPRPVYRQIFCDLFGKNAEELGLLEKSVEPSKAHVASSETTNPQVSNSGKSAIPEEPPPSAATHLQPEEQTPLQSNGKVHRESLNEAPHVENFYGRNQELGTLKHWILDEHCRLVAVLGMGGLGKTTLSSALVQHIKDSFEYVFWRSLQNAPPLTSILQQCMQFIFNQQPVDLPESIDDQLSLLIQALRDHHCLLVLDNIESILQAGGTAGQYREGYENYGLLLRRIGEIQHRSCLLLTSREKPKEVARLEGNTLPVRLLHLLGLGHNEGQELLNDKNLFGSNEQWRELVKLYSGNPLALRLGSEYIEGLFDGDIARFLAEEETTFGDINDLLDQHFHRLSVQEQEILYWLALEREAVSLERMRENLVRPAFRGTVLEALNSLQRRSMLERQGSAQFMLQPVILEYITNRITKQAFEEFVAGTADNIWANYALMQAQARDYVRDSQIRLILHPVAIQLLSMFGKKGLDQHLRGMLATQRQLRPNQGSYFAGNALNLLIHLNHDLQGADCSSLTIRQANFQHVSLYNVDFSAAYFADCVFSSTLGNVLAVTFSPHGKRLAAGTATGEIWVYQVPDGTPLLTCYGHTDGVWALAFSSDEHILVSSSDDGSIRLWDTSTGQCLKTLQGHTNRVRSVALNPGDTVLASGSDDRAIRLWDTHTGQCFKILQGHTDRVWSVAFSPAGTVLASGSTDGSICLWEVDTGHCLRRLQGHTSGIRSIAFSPDGSLLASGSDDSTVRLWEVSTGCCLTTLHGHTNRVWSVAFSPGGQTFASGSEDQTIRLWDIHGHHPLKLLQNHTHGVRSVSFSPAGQLLASGGDDQTLRFWDVNSGYCLKTLQGHTMRVWSIAFDPAGCVLISISEDQAIRLWDVQTGRCTSTLQEHEHGARCIAFSPRGNIFASGGEDQAVRLWDANTGHCLRTLRGHSNWIWAIAFSPDGQSIASGSEDHDVRLWDASTGDCLFTLQGHASWVRSVSFSADGSTLASSSDNGIIKLWDTKTGRHLSTLHGHTNRVRSVAFSPLEFILASGSEDHTVRLWDASTGQCLHILSDHTGRVRSVAFNPNGSLLASGSEDQTIRLWDVKTGDCLHTLRGHANRVRSVTFSIDGQTLASSSDDGTIKLWDISTAQLLKTLRSDRPYERMNITNVKGLTEAQKAALRALGAIENDGMDFYMKG